MMDWFWIGVGAICGAIVYMFVSELRQRIKFIYNQHEDYRERIMDLELRVKALENYTRGKE